jgi:hypothetical protein
MPRPPIYQQFYLCAYAYLRCYEDLKGSIARIIDPFIYLLIGLTQPRTVECRAAW